VNIEVDTQASLATGERSQYSLNRLLNWCGVGLELSKKRREEKREEKRREKREEGRERRERREEKRREEKRREEKRREEKTEEKRREEKRREEKRREDRRREVALALSGIEPPTQPSQCNSLAFVTRNLLLNKIVQWHQPCVWANSAHFYGTYCTT